MTEKEILTEAYISAQNLDLSTISDTIKQDVNVLIN